MVGTFMNVFGDGWKMLGVIWGTYLEVVGTCLECVGCVLKLWEQILKFWGMFELFDLLEHLRKCRRLRENIQDHFWMCLGQLLEKPNNILGIPILRVLRF